MIKKCLKELGIDKYKINYKTTTSNELFFILKKIDLTRSKEVTHCIVTLYHEHTHLDKLCLGSASGEIYSSMSKNEILQTLEVLYLAASFVHNEYFELVEGVKEKQEDRERNELEVVSKIIQAIDSVNESINSVEVFVNFNKERIINSNGVDVSYEYNDNMVEFVINARDYDKEIEILKAVNFGDFDETLLVNQLMDGFNEAKDRIVATNTPKLKDIDVLIGGRHVLSIFNYFLGKASASSVNQRISDLKMNDKILGNNADLLNIQAVAYLENSGKNFLFDDDGASIDNFYIYKDSQLIHCFGDYKEMQYIGVKEKRNAFNFVIGSGSIKDEDLIDPYLEIISFSSFQVDITTGSYAGEIRLGYYYDGNVKKSITGGSVSGNIVNELEDLKFSKELKQFNNMVVPKFVCLKNATIASIE